MNQLRCLGGTAIALIGILSPLCHGVTYTDAAHGALQVELRIDPGGRCSLANVAGSQVSINGYELVSTMGGLDPSGWTATGTRTVSTAHDLAVSLSSPVNLASNGSIDQGFPFPAGTSADVFFYYTRPNTGGARFLGRVLYGIDVSEVLVRTYSDKNRNGQFDGSDEWLPGMHAGIMAEYGPSFVDFRDVTTDQHGSGVVWPYTGFQYTVSLWPQAGWVSTTSATISGTADMAVPVYVEFGGYYVPEPVTVFLVGVCSLAALKRRIRR